MLFDAHAAYARSDHPHLVAFKLAGLIAAALVLAAAPSVSAHGPTLIGGVPVVVGDHLHERTDGAKRSTKELKVERHLVMARHFEVYEDDAKAALREYKKVLKLDREHLKAGLAIASLELRLGQTDKALAQLKKLTRAHPKSVAAWQALAQAYDKAKRPGDATEAYRSLVAVQPDHADAHLRIAQALFDRASGGDKAVVPALTEHLKAFRRFSTNKHAPAFKLAGRMIAEIEGGPVAGVVFEAQQAFDAAWSDARSVSLNEKMGEARRGFEKCITMAPDRQECHHYLGLVHASVKASEHYDLSRARASFLRAPDVSDAHVELAIIKRKEGDDAGAVASLDDAIALDERNQRAWHQLGIAQKLLGEDDEAIEAFSKAYELDRRSSVASEALGELTILEPDHRHVQSTLRFGGVQGDVFDSEKFKSAVLAFESRFGGVDPDAPEKMILEEVIERIVSGADLQTTHTLRVQVLNATIVNAFAMPNGHIYFTKGFFEFLRKYFPDTPIDAEHEALAHVMAHEVVHVLQQHVVRSAVFREATTDASQRIEPTVLTHLTRIHEIEADRMGMVLAFLAGYHPRGGIAFMEARGKEHEIPTHLDHPTYDERIAYLEEYWSNTVRYAWLSFRFGLGHMDEAQAAEASDLRKAAALYRKAVDDFKRFEQSLRPTKETLNNVGIAYAKLGLFRMAGTDTPLHLWNTRFSVERDLAMTYVSVREAEESSTRKRSAPGASPGASRPRIPRELKQAVRRFKQALAKDPGYDKAHVNLTMVYLAMDKLEDAKDAIESVADASAAGGAGTVANLKGVVYAAAGDGASALASFMTAQTDATAKPAALYNTARVHQVAGRADEAKAAYEAYLAVEPAGAWATSAARELTKL